MPFTLSVKQQYEYSHYMKDKGRRWLIILVCVLAGTFSMGQDKKIAITHITVFTKPFQPPIKDATILIENGEFTQIGPAAGIRLPSGYKVINAKGKFATAGFWNSHVHFIEPVWESADAQVLENQMSKMLNRWGFTYVFDLAQLNFNNLNGIRKRISEKEILGPAIYAVGEPFCSKSPYYIHPAKLAELTTRQQVRLHVEQQITNGANGIKLWSASPTGNGVDLMPDSLIQEAATICKKYQLPLFAHPTNNAGVRTAIANGVSVLAHVAPDERQGWDTSILNEMTRRKIALIPTLKLFSWELRKEGLGDPNPLTETASHQLTNFVNAGLRVLFGTDVGYMSDYDPTEEYLLMQKAGMSFHQILASLTTAPSAQFNNRKTGSVEKGLSADLVILNSDPSQRISNLADVAMVFRNGMSIYTAEKK